MSDKKLTVYQRLGQMFGPEGVNTPKYKTNRYSIGSKELIRTNSKDELNQAKLQAQQNQYLSNQWKKVDNEMIQQSIHYETTRIGSYSDFESMEFFPEIAAALDIMMEESTTPNEKGAILNVHSSSKRVKSILEDLFTNRLSIHTNLPAWARNVCKYGDDFVFLNIDDKAGVIGCKQMPNIEMERREGDLYNAITQHSGIVDDEGSEYDNKIKFHWKGRDVDFNSWQIAHFRLLGDDRKLPYGTSFLEKARRIWKQLLLSEDAMLVYRVTRAPERRIYKIYVGNIDDADVEAYVDGIANRFKRAPVIDPQTGQIDLRYNQMGQDQDIFVPVRDENASSPIDTLPGAANLDAIADIEYLQNKLFTALRIPKPFLGFDSAVGDGKNLAIQDIRFSRTVNRIQQALIMELNKIAIIHLYLLGLEDDLDNFTLTLNNPSTQAEMLKVEHLQTKVSLYTTAVSDAGNGFGAMSMTRAKRDILNMSDDEIKQDILEQRMEKAAAAELANTAKIIKYTGLFDKVDNIYADPESLQKSKEGGSDEGDGEEGADDFGGGGGGFGGGGGDFGSGDDMDFGDEGEEGEEGDDDFGADDIGGDGADDIGGDEGFGESMNRKSDKLLVESKKKALTKFNERALKHQTTYLNKLIGLQTPVKTTITETTKLSDKNVKFNNEIDDMISTIDKKLEE